MLIQTLAENTAVSKDFGSEHGLSLLIETKKHKILFDVGASALFLQNARKLGADISDVDFLVISHGHYDHGGGLKTFFAENTKAEVFVHRLAFEEHYARRPNDQLEFIGLDAELQENKRIIRTSDRFFVCSGVQVFSNIMPKEPRPKSNGGLFAVHAGEMAADTFAHEQNLVVEEDGKTLLVTGCAHNGIINILEHFHMLRGRMPDYVIGGFHLDSRSGGKESPAAIDRIGEYLLRTRAKFYTCHCTGTEAYESLQAAMGERIAYLSAGSVIEL